MAELKEKYVCIKFCFELGGKKAMETFKMLKAVAELIMSRTEASVFPAQKLKTLEVH